MGLIFKMSNNGPEECPNAPNVPGIYSLVIGLFGLVCRGQEVMGTGEFRREAFAN